MHITSRVKSVTTLSHLGSNLLNKVSNISFAEVLMRYISIHKAIYI